MRGLVLGSLLVVAWSGAVQAGWLDWMGGSDKKSAVACAPAERDCLIMAALENRITAFHDREHDLQIKRIGQQIGKIGLLANDAQRKAIEARLAEVKRSAKLREFYHETLRKTSTRNVISLQDLQSAIAEGAAPDGGKLGDYVLAGFQQALERDEGDAARRLWFDSTRALWSNSARALHLMQENTARNDIDLLEAYHDKFFFSGTRRQKMWGSMSAIAQLHCLNGETDKGNRVLALLQGQFSRRAPKDQVIRLYAETEFLAPILYCRGEEAAMNFLGGIEAKMVPAFDFLREKYPDDAEQAFVLGAARDTIALRTYEVLARYLLEQGRETEAKAIFEEGKRSRLVMGFAEGSNGKIKAQTSSEKLGWEDFRRYFEEDRYRYSPSPKLALEHFLTGFEPDYTNPYTLNQTLDSYADHAETLWPSELSQKAVARLMRISRDNARRDPRRLAYPDHIMLEFAAWPQPASCHLSEEILRGVIGRMADYEFKDEPFRAVIAMLTYQDRVARAKPSDGLCALALVPENDL